MQKYSTKIKAITAVGILSASIIILKQFTITIPFFFKIDLTHIIVIISGFIFGPFVGAWTGFVGDFIGGILKGWSAFPIIFPWGFMMLGILSGLTKKWNVNRLNITFLYFATHFVIEFITYAIFFTIFTGRFKTLWAAAIVYYPARFTKMFLLLPIWLIALPLIYKRINRK